MFLPASTARCYWHPMLLSLLPDLDHLTDREREQARWHPERDTLELAARGAATVLGARHSATRAFAKAAATMATVDLWHARLALRTLGSTSARPSRRRRKGETRVSLPSPRPSAGRLCASRGAR